MSKITDFRNQVKLNKIEREIKAAIELVCQANGVGFKQSGIRYSETTAKFSVELLTSSDEGSVNADKIQYERYAGSKGLNVNAFGAEFEASDADMYTVVGIKPKAKKYALQAKSHKDGVVYGIPVSMLPAKMKFGYQG